MAMVEDERSKIPNLMNIGSITSDMNMDYDTTVLDPVVNNQSFCRFCPLYRMLVYRRLHDPSFSVYVRRFYRSPCADVHIMCCSL